MSQIKQEDRLSVTDIRKSLRDPNDPALWVLNTSDLGGRRQLGEILIEVNTKNGRSVAVKIEKTWIPQDLTLTVSKEDLINSPTFTRSIGNGVITPIKSSTAEAIMKSEEAQNVQMLLQLRQQGLTEKPVSNEELLGNRPPRAPAGEQNYTVEEAASLQVQQIMSKPDDQLDPNLKLASLQNIMPQLTHDDCRFILSKCVGPEHEPLRKFANDMASKKR